ncbi:hypothetical protein R5R35_011650 [Gryllus longicercus]|uniref:Odorant binding protein n=1 Tax=Gryllus longicercus TaxID=2509291 RepID=A0AAN9VPS7_9ORTH
MQPAAAAAAALAAALLFAAALQVTVAEVPEKLKEIAAKCRGEHPISDDELNGLKSLTIPETDEGKCFLGCMFEEMGLLVDGKFSQENAVKLMKEKLEEKPDEIEKHMQLIEKCNDEVASHDNKCETGPKLLECFKTFAPGFGIVLPGSE